jgi:hypothetical protein
MLIGTLHFKYKTLIFLRLQDGMRPFNDRAAGTNTHLFYTVFRYVNVTGQVSEATCRSRTVNVRTELTISVHSLCLLTYCSKREKSEHRIFDKVILVPQHNYIRHWG